MITSPIDDTRPCVKASNSTSHAFTVTWLPIYPSSPGSR